MNDAQWFRQPHKAGVNEFLINPANIKVLGTVNIRDAFIKTLKEQSNSTILDNCLKEEERTKEKARKGYDSNGHPPFNDSDMLARQKAASLWWIWYALENDCLIEDYRKIVGTNQDDYDISMKRCSIHRIIELQDEYFEEECQEKLDKLRKYVIFNATSVRKDA